MFANKQKDKRLPDVDGGMIAWGAVFGFVIGGLVTLFTAPKSGKENRQQITQTAENVQKQVKISLPAPNDPVKDSLAEGKAAARRRRDQMGVER